MAKSKKDQADSVQVAPVDKYPERPYDEALRTPEDTVLAEGRLGQQDQYPSYHEVYPTLKESEAHNPEVQREVLAKANAQRVSKSDVKEAAEELPEVVEG